jgi:hypothetical protein
LAPEKAASAPDDTMAVPVSWTSASSYSAATGGFEIYMIAIGPSALSLIAFFYFLTHNCYAVVVDICVLVEFLLDFGGFVERSGGGRGIRSRVLGTDMGKDLSLDLHHAPGVKGGLVDA